MMRRVKLFTHTDLDGVGCALVAKVWARSSHSFVVDITFCQNNEVNTAVESWLAKEADTYDSCYITDLSVSKNVADIISASKVDVRLLDHHPSAQWLNEYPWASVCINMFPGLDKLTCGTQMLYEELFPVCTNSRLAQFVDAVREWDTWDWKKTDAWYPQMYNTLLGLKGRNLFMEELLPKLTSDLDLPDGWEELWEGEADNKRSYIEEKSSQTFEYEYEGNLYIGVCASKYVSELGSTLSERYPDHAGVIIINEGTISLRTARDDVDLSAIAKNMGGGGHKQAAGFVITSDTKKKMLDIIFSNSLEEIE